jgi:hypothetical protein
MNVEGDGLCSGIRAGVCCQPQRQALFKAISMFSGQRDD